MFKVNPKTAGFGKSVSFPAEEKLTKKLYFCQSFLG